MLQKSTKRTIATLLLILMCVQYIPLERYGVSYIKFGVMCLSPLIWLTTSAKISRAVIWGGLYFLVTLFSTLFNPNSFRVSTVGYLLSFICMFIAYYNLIVCEEALSIDLFIKILKRLIAAYTICLLLQQTVHLVGIESLPLINTFSTYGRGALAGNSLSIEPSHSARILTATLLTLLRSYDVKWGKANVTLRAIYADAKWIILGFMWSMVTMGSGTAFVGLAILSLYFVKRRYILTSLPLLAALYFATPHIDFEPLQRAKVTFETALTLDNEAIIKADNSAAYRIVPLVNTITKLDLLSVESWLGSGVDNGNNALSEESMIGGIKSYGLLSYALLLILIFKCCIDKILSLEMMIFIILLAATVGNIAYVWGILMLFATSKYFIDNHKINQNGRDT